MKRLAVLNVVGLTPELIGIYTPHITQYAEKNKLSSISTIVPAVTCSVQSTFLTGKYPEETGIVGNGWYFKDLCEIAFWKQSNKLVQREKIWNIAKKQRSDFTCANICWWYNMYSDVDYSVTPRPIYLADGRKIPDFYCEPPEIKLLLKKQIGNFPLFHFWGPKTTIFSSQWIAQAAMHLYEKYMPYLSLVYLPHLDYCLQKFGPNLEIIQKDLKEIDQVVGILLAFFKKKDVGVVILSEYGITSVSRPIHLNRILRKEGYLRLKNELGRELLDTGASTAFAVADHQIAHIYIRQLEKKETIRKCLESIEGVDAVWDREEKKTYHLAHERAGDLIAIADKESWFSYYYWLDDKKAPDFARTVDIHRKPGYDPVELFIDPDIKLPILKIFIKLLRKRCGFRQLMDIIPLRAELVKGSHGRVNSDRSQSPVFISSDVTKYNIHATEVCRKLLEMMNLSLA